MKLYKKDSFTFLNVSPTMAVAVKPQSSVIAMHPSPSINCHSAAADIGCASCNQVHKQMSSAVHSGLITLTEAKMICET